MDDEIKDQLRRLADVEPPVAVDRTRVLRAGRRRRLARRAGSAVAGLLLVAGAVPAVAMLGSDPSPPPAAPVPTPTEVAPPVPRAVVDHVNGTITLPMDEVRGDALAWTVIATASTHFRSGCMANRGYGELWSFDGPIHQPSWMNLPYGMWRESDVRQVGYGPFLVKQTETENGRSIEHTEGDPEVEAIRACESAIIEAGLGADVAALQEEFSHGGWQPALEGRVVRELWERCLAESGVRAPTDEWSWVPEEAWDASLDDQVRIGLIDVSCKERLDLVQRMGDLDAAAQAAHLEQHAEYYAALQRSGRAVLQNAREYLAEHGISVD